MTWLVGLAIASGAPAAIRADEHSVMVDVAPAAPFDAAQLAAALRLRLPAGGSPVRVRVIAIPGGVRIEARGNARDVALRGSTGPAAARLVALAATDLLLDDLAVAPEVPAASPGVPHAVTIAALGGIVGWAHELASVGVDLAVARGRWLVAVEAGGGTLISGSLHLTAGVLRLGAGARLGPFELRAGATVMPLSVGSGTGDTTALVGAGASARLRAPITASVHGVLSIGDDVFANRTTYMLEQVRVLSTPRNSLWFEAGLEVTP
jgi:hypothetical protein